MEKFLEIYGTLPRAGPGSNELTRRAFEAITGLPASPKILDVGCGPGMQTVELLKLSNAKVTALDMLPDMIDRVTAAAHSAGVAKRLVTLQQDMNEMTFPPASFDVVWSEAAIYIMGFQEGLEKFKALVKPGGYIVVSEVVWLKPDPPAEVVEFWSEYPGIDSIDAKLAVIDKVGLEVVDHFVFPATAWTKQYYDPMEARIAEKEKQWSGDHEGEAILSAARNEISLFKRYKEFYNYAFFIMRKH